MHPLENLCMPQEWILPNVSNKQSKALTTLLNVYMDDFIGLAQAITKEELLHFTWAVLHGIHTVFLPPGPTDDPED